MVFLAKRFPLRNCAVLRRTGQREEVGNYTAQHARGLFDVFVPLYCVVLHRATVATDGPEGGESPTVPSGAAQAFADPLLIDPRTLNALRRASRQPEVAVGPGSVPMPCHRRIRARPE